MNTGKRVAVGLAVVALVYLASYLAVMRAGLAVDPVTFRVAYPSICLFARNVRIPGDLSVYGASSHPLNPIYAPLDRLFRNKMITEMNAVNERISALKDEKRN